MHDKTRRQTDAYQEVFAKVKSKHYRFVCFDFGGTLFDFTPLHVSAFLNAMEVPFDTPLASQVESAVRSALFRGVDSFEMMREVAAQTQKMDEQLCRDIVLKKRTLIEYYLDSAILDPNARSFLLRVMNYAHVAVLSRGLVQSMEDILARTFSVDPPSIRVYGRHSLDERVDKCALLETALRDSGIPKAASLYVGDAQVDRLLAEAVQLNFIHIQPFEF
ncbi:HAD family hydrolase [Longimicrobium sp.]|uniref:HAD family hydrolase n=1 Tax=Longimicrobium sp. TaxID=2029185 RepID=UPI003B3B3D78